MENFYSSLTEEEKRIYDKYKSNDNSFCYNLNDYLRKKNYSDNKFEYELKVLDSIFAKTPSHERIILYRATTENTIIPFIQETNYINPEYLSTCTDKISIQQHFTSSSNPVYLEIICPDKSQILDLEANKNYGSLEREILINRNTLFRVIENEITLNLSEIENIMGRYYAQGVSSLRKIIIEKKST